jgi:stage IV sporulation protein FB
LKAKVDLKIFFILLLYTLTQKVEIFTITFIFIILHEIGHIVSGILLGLKINKLQLNIAGISLEFKNYGKERKINNIIIDLAGPLINLISAIIGIFIKLEIIIYVNAMLFIINMLPIYPLDGGRILKNILLYKNTYKQTIKTMETISKYTLIILSIFASILILSFKNISIFILVIYLWGIYIKERHKNQLIKRVYQTIENNT